MIISGHGVASRNVCSILDSIGQQWIYIIKNQWYEEQAVDLSCVTLMWRHYIILTYRFINKSDDALAYPKRKPESCLDANFVVSGETRVCRYDNLACHQWRQSIGFITTSRFLIALRYQMSTQWHHVLWGCRETIPLVLSKNYDFSMRSWHLSHG